MGLSQLLHSQQLTQGMTTQQVTFLDRFFYFYYLFVGEFVAGGAPKQILVVQQLKTCYPERRDTTGSKHKRRDKEITNTYKYDLSNMTLLFSKSRNSHQDLFRYINQIIRTVLSAFNCCAITIHLFFNLVFSYKLQLLSSYFLIIAVSGKHQFTTERSSEIA